jgi:protease-4
MAKFLIGIITGLILAFLTAVVVVFSLARMGESKPQVPAQATLVLNLQGEIPERPGVEYPIPFVDGGASTTMRDVWAGLRTAAGDSRIHSVLVIADRSAVGWGKASEIRQGILNFKRSGKPVHAFLRSPGMKEYYIASAADRIYAAPEDLIDVKGMRVESMYIKNTLEKLGVGVEVFHRGRYKDAGDMFTETSMSPETRESLGLLLDGVYGTVLEVVSHARKKTPEQIRGVVNAGPFTAREAHAKGLVDALRYEDQVLGELKTALKKKEDLKRIAVSDYVRATDGGRKGKHRIAWIVGEGAIVRGSGGGGLGGEEVLASQPFIRLLRRVREDKSIKGAVIRINSPGGDAFASDEILREVRLLRDRKPLVFSMSDSAASGGYYIAMTGDPIVAYPNTITGSIGVLFAKINLRDLYHKLGIQKDILARGDNAAIDSDYVPTTPEARKKIESGIEEFYRSFVGQAATSRKMKYTDFEPHAQGRVWLGSHAEKLNLLDEVGGIDTTLKVLKTRMKVDAKDDLALIPYPPKRTWLEMWLQRDSWTALIQRRGWAEAAHRFLGWDVRAFIPGGYLRVLPVTIDIR